MNDNGLFRRLLGERPWLSSIVFVVIGTVCALVCFDHYSKKYGQHGFVLEWLRKRYTCVLCRKTKRVFTPKIGVGGEQFSEEEATVCSLWFDKTFPSGHEHVWNVAYSHEMVNYRFKPNGSGGSGDAGIDFWRISPADQLEIYLAAESPERCRKLFEYIATNSLVETDETEKHLSIVISGLDSWHDGGFKSSWCNILKALDVEEVDDECETELEGK